jgi:hypothetical protein
MTQFLVQLIRRSGRDEWERLLLSRRSIDRAMEDRRREQNQAFTADIERRKAPQAA